MCRRSTHSNVVEYLKLRLLQRQMAQALEDVAPGRTHNASSFPSLQGQNERDKIKAGSAAITVCIIATKL